MSTSRKKLAIVAGLGLGSLALVGVGAGASFTDSVSATQKINTGTLSFALSSVDSPGSTPASVTNGGHSITWDLENSGSQINENHLVTVTNTGTLPLYMSTVTVKPSGANDTPLANDVTMKLDQSQLSVADAQGTAWDCTPKCVLQPKETYSFPMNFTGNLNNADEGQTITPTLTVVATEVSKTGGPLTRSLASGATAPAMHLVPAN